ncbi:uncharacterized protein TNCV_4598141 [Trichonephila clavipes]|nr:uncharacterized protein TNCV_4598141 [Trichonephila clavipes]
MDDNATCHRTLAAQDCLDSEGIQRLVWPARSPDLNYIENVWDALGRQVAGRNYPPTNKNTLIRALTEEWDKLPQQLLDNVVQKVWYDVWNVASHSTVDISRIDTFLFKVPADFLDTLFHFSVRSAFSHSKATRGALEMDLVAFSHGRMARTTPELVPFTNLHPKPTVGHWASIDLTCINSSTQWVFIGPRARNS